MTSLAVSTPAQRLATGTINRELATLRKALGLAYEWRLIVRLPKVRLLPGEKGREYVLTGEMELAYLAAIDYPLKQAAILMLDCGLRPEEVVSLKKADIAREAIIIGVLPLSLTVREGKTANAARSLPLTARAREAIELVCKLWPDSEWLFPSSKRSSEGHAIHMTRGHLDHLHQAARERHGWPREFVIYACRHTFGTRLAESGASPFEIRKAMGHHSVKVSEKYVHLSADSLSLALKRKEAYDAILRGEAHDDASSSPLSAIRPDKTVVQ